MKTILVHQHKMRSSISHCDNIQATGFLEHIKLPHYVDFQSELELIRKIRLIKRKVKRQ